MSGPVENTDTESSNFGMSSIEVREGRTAKIGQLNVLRVMPTKRRRTIGPWCFVDLMSPEDVERPPPIEIGPHPHIGLATVTWLFGGLVLHSDSLGSEQPIRPGELNLMTAGHGIAHAEQGLDTEATAETGGVMGVQMWLAQPDAQREGRSAFQHLDSLPEVELDNGGARVLIGGYESERSLAVFDHPAVGLDVTFSSHTLLVTRSEFEHGIVPIDRAMKVEDVIVEPGSIAVIPPGHDQLRLETRGGPGRVMLLGGLPLGEQVKMWWNFVARTEEEITSAWRDWQMHNTDRFGPVPSDLARIDAPRPPWIQRTD